MLLSILFSTPNTKLFFSAVYCYISFKSKKTSHLYLQIVKNLGFIIIVQVCIFLGRFYYKT